MALPWAGVQRLNLPAPRPSRGLTVTDFPHDSRPPRRRHSLDHWRFGRHWPRGGAAPAAGRLDGCRHRPARRGTGGAGRAASGPHHPGGGRRDRCGADGGCGGAGGGGGWKAHRACHSERGHLRADVSAGFRQRRVQVAGGREPDRHRQRTGRRDAGADRARAGAVGHCGLGGRVSRPAHRDCLCGHQGGADCHGGVAEIRSGPGRGADARHQPRLRAHAADRQEHVPDAVPDRGGRRRQPHRARTAPHGLRNCVSAPLRRHPEAAAHPAILAVFPAGGAGHQGRSRVSRLTPGGSAAPAPHPSSHGGSRFRNRPDRTPTAA